MLVLITRAPRAPRDAWAFGHVVWVSQYDWSKAQWWAYSNFLHIYEKKNKKWTPIFMGGINDEYREKFKKVKVRKIEQIERGIEMF